MCEKCGEFEEAIARYRRLQQQISDEGVQDAADSLIAELEANKAALHPD